jgi:hypothetical protein
VGKGQGSLSGLAAARRLTCCPPPQKTAVAVAFCKPCKEGNTGTIKLNGEHLRDPSPFECLPLECCPPASAPQRS